jgi:Tfp pilus assembly protein PilN
MNLHVNLLHAAERRRPGGVIARTVLRATTIALVAAMLLMLAQALAARVNVQHQADAVDARWSRIEPEFKRAQELRAEYDTLQRQLSELDAFSNVQVRVAARLRSLATLVPPAIQLTELTLRHDAATVGGEPARCCVVKLAGRTSGLQADETVRAFIEALRDSPPPADFGTVAAGSFGLASLDTESEQVNLFEVTATFNPRSFR